MLTKISDSGGEINYGRVTEVYETPHAPAQYRRCAGKLPETPEIVLRNVNKKIQKKSGKIVDNESGS